MKDVGCEKCGGQVELGRVGSRLRGRCQDDGVRKLGEESPCRLTFADIGERGRRSFC